jgi:hypothetical protein
VESESSNYRELRNLLEAVEEEDKVGYLADSEIWLFTDNSMTESCFYKGGLSSKTLHKLVLRLKRAELEAEFALFVVHVAGTRMIAQGTGGLSRGIILKGVMSGENMLHFIPLAQSARERQPILVSFLQECVGQALQHKVKVLQVEEWFQEGHGIISGYKDSHGVWIPRHAKNGRVYLWASPVIADVALKECLKAVQKRMDTYHIFLLPRLFAPAWLCMFYKLADVIFTIPVGSSLWPFNMHEPLFIGIALPFIRCRPWSLRGMPMLVELAGDCNKRSSPVLVMEGLFCANFSEPRACWPPCQMCWHAKCYKCMGIGTFPMKMHQDAQGNPWFR